MADVKSTALPTVTTAATTDTAIINASSKSSKITLSNLGTRLLNVFSWSNLTTTAKTIIGAINENKSSINTLNTNLTSVQTNLNNNMTLDQIRNMIRPDLSDKKTDLLEISFDRWSTVNRTRTFYAPTTNVPSAITSSAFMGLWECIWIDSTHVGVRLTEMFPQRGRIWTNFYNYKQWEGWASNT